MEHPVRWMPFIIEWMVRRLWENLLGIRSLRCPRLGSECITHDFLYLIEIIGKEERENSLPLTKGKIIDSIIR